MFSKPNRRFCILVIFCCITDCISVLELLYKIYWAHCILSNIFGVNVLIFPPLACMFGVILEIICESRRVRLIFPLEWLTVPECYNIQFVVVCFHLYKHHSSQVLGDERSTFALIVNATDNFLKSANELTFSNAAVISPPRSLPFTLATA